MSKTIEEILTPKPKVRPRIYAYAIADKAHAGLLKVGQTTRNHSLSSIRNGGEGRGEEGFLA